MTIKEATERIRAVGGWKLASVNVSPWPRERWAAVASAGRKERMRTRKHKASALRALVAAVEAGEGQP